MQKQQVSAASQKQMATNGEYYDPFAAFDLYRDAVAGLGATMALPVKLPKGVYIGSPDIPVIDPQRRKIS